MNVLMLTKLELKKMLKTNVAIIGIILTIMIMSVVTFIEYNDTKSSSMTSTSINWREREEFLLSESQNILSDPYYDEVETEQVLKRLEIAKYRLNNNISKDYYKTSWWFFNDSSFNWVVRFIILITVIIGVFNLTMEFDKKTIRFWAVSPYKRNKILTSKYLATFIYSFMLLGIVFIFGLLSGIIIYGLNSGALFNVLYGINGPYIMKISTYSIIVVLLKFIEIIFTVSLVFMIGMLLKSIAFSTIVSIITTFIIAPIVLYAGKVNNLYNYLPFNHLDFRKFLDFGTVLPEVNNDFSSIILQGFTPIIAGTIVFIYILLFTIITYTIFCKNDLC